MYNVHKRHGAPSVHEFTFKFMTAFDPLTRPRSFLINVWTYIPFRLPADDARAFPCTMYFIYKWCVSIGTRNKHIAISIKRQYIRKSRVTRWQWLTALHCRLTREHALFNGTRHTTAFPPLSAVPSANTSVNTIVELLLIIL